MQIIVHELEEPLQIDREFKPDALKFAHEGAQVVAPTHLTATVTRQDEHDVYIQGALTTALALTCSLCLKTFTWPIHQPLDLFYEPMNKNAGEHELHYNEMDISYYLGDAIDVEQFLTEQIELLVPMKPVCAADCKGLCEVCGADRNTETCRCLREVVDDRARPLVDDRLRSLIELKKKLKSEE